jgi:phage FluMu protein Com
MKVRTVEENRVCRLAWCGKVLVRNENESAAGFRKRQTCGRAHGAELSFMHKKMPRPTIINQIGLLTNPDDKGRPYASKGRGW